MVKREVSPATARLLYVVVALLLFIGKLCADPENILVGDLIFSRPPAWKWVSPDPNSPAVSSFIVSNGGKTGEVRFYAHGKEAAAANAIWKAYFDNADQQNAKEETVTIGKRIASYFFCHGTLTLPGQKPANNQGFVGVVIPYEDQCLHIRFTGPEELVRNATPLLRVMVETALKEKAEESGN